MTKVEIIETALGAFHVSRDSESTHHFFVVSTRTGNMMRVRARSYEDAASKGKL